MPGPQGPNWAGARCSVLPYDPAPPSLQLAISGSVHQKYPPFSKSGEAAITLGIWEYSITCKALGPCKTTVILGYLWLSILQARHRARETVVLVMTDF